MEDWGERADPEEVGKSAHPANSPPALSDGDEWILQWYLDNATGFAKEFGLMPGFIDGLGLDGESRAMFLYKVAWVHKTMMKIGQDRARKEMEARYGRH